MTLCHVRNDNEEMSVDFREVKDKTCLEFNIGTAVSISWNSRLLVGHLNKLSNQPRSLRERRGTTSGQLIA